MTSHKNEQNISINNSEGVHLKNISLNVERKGNAEKLPEKNELKLEETEEKQFLKLILEGEVKKAVGMLLQKPANKNHKELILLANRLSNLEREIISDTLAVSEVMRERNKITQSLLNLIQN